MQLTTDTKILVDILKYISSTYQIFEENPVTSELNSLQYPLANRKPNHFFFYFFSKFIYFIYIHWTYKELFIIWSEQYKEYVLLRFYVF